MNRWDIAIIGSGPAGAAAAWTICRLDKKLAERTAIFEAGRHPREKICAGCVTGRSWRLLQNYGMKAEVKTIPVHAVRFLTAAGDITLPRKNVGAIVRRSEFDAALLNNVRGAGPAVLEGRRVLEIRRISDGFELLTSGPQARETHRAKIIIGCDGATSIARKFLSNSRRAHVRTFMLETPLNENFQAHPEDTLTFDFRPVRDGLRGYRWIFPALTDTGSKSLSVGLCDFNPEQTTPTQTFIDKLMDEYNLDSGKARSREYPFYTFDTSDTLGGHGWLLAGEAAGSDGLLAEGISYALESGAFAAEYAVNSLKSGDLSMKRWTHDYHWSRVGKELRTLRIMAAMFYSRPLHMRMLRAGLFNEELCRVGGEILAGEIEPRTKVALGIAANLFKTMLTQLCRGDS